MTPEFSNVTRGRVASLKGISQKISVKDASRQKGGRRGMYRKVEEQLSSAKFLLLDSNQITKTMILESLLYFTTLHQITEFSATALTVPSAHSTTLGFVIFTAWSHSNSVTNPCLLPFGSVCLSGVSKDIMRGGWYKYAII
ncbi:hypothetical protein BDQ17DRAFT_1333432 [Cyathus striatus]|nr:hypothetical protein BDQ17DRAFT_1333432 [Cyathus striatus]